MNNIRRTADGTKGVAFAALRHRAFRGYFMGDMLSMMADNTEHVISYWVIFHLFHSPALAGFAVVSHWMPHLWLRRDSRLEDTSSGTRRRGRGHSHA